MASTQQIKRRIKSVKSTSQITKAMELVAASKMRRAQEATLKSRAYRNTARELLTQISHFIDVKRDRLFVQREVKTRLYIIITGDRGLAGAYNSTVLKAFAAELKKDKNSDIKSQAIFIGRQGARFGAKLEDLEVIGVYEKFPDNPSANDINPILRTISKAFAPRQEANDDKDEGFEQSKPTVDKVDVIFTDFVTSIRQEVRLATLLPAAFEPAESPVDLTNDMPFEPSPEAVLQGVAPRLIEVQLFQAILESQASEHVSRMMAMKSASDNARDLIDDLTLVFNGARQAAITQELAEITSGAEAIK